MNSTKKNILSINSPAKNSDERMRAYLKAAGILYKNYEVENNKNYLIECHKLMRMALFENELKFIKR